MQPQSVVILRSTQGCIILVKMLLADGSAGCLALPFPKKSHRVGRTVPGEPQE